MPGWCCGSLEDFRYSSCLLYTTKKNIIFDHKKKKSYILYCSRKLLPCGKSMILKPSHPPFFLGSIAVICWDCASYHPLLYQLSHSWPLSIATCHHPGRPAAESQMLSKTMFSAWFWEKFKFLIWVGQEFTISSGQILIHEPSKA